MASTSSAGSSRTVKIGSGAYNPHNESELAKYYAAYDAAALEFAGNVQGKHAFARQKARNKMKSLHSKLAKKRSKASSTTTTAQPGPVAPSKWPTAPVPKSPMPRTSSPNDDGPTLLEQSDSLSNTTMGKQICDEESPTTTTSSILPPGSEDDFDDSPPSGQPRDYEPPSRSLASFSSSGKPSATNNGTSRQSGIPISNDQKILSKSSLRLPVNENSAQLISSSDAEDESRSSEFPKLRSCVSYLLENGVTASGRATNMIHDDTINEVVKLFPKPANTFVLETCLGANYNPTPGRILRGFKDNATSRWIITICEGMHWCVAVIKKGDSVISYFDSMNEGEPQSHFKSCVQRIVDHHLKQIGISKFVHVSVPCQQQRDLHNCGVFAMYNIECILSGLDHTINEVLPESLRYRYAKALIAAHPGIESSVRTAMSAYWQKYGDLIKIHETSGNAPLSLSSSKGTGSLGRSDVESTESKSARLPINHAGSKVSTDMAKESNLGSLTVGRRNAVRALFNNRTQGVASSSMPAAFQNSSQFPTEGFPLGPSSVPAMNLATDIPSQATSRDDDLLNATTINNGNIPSSPPSLHVFKKPALPIHRTFPPGAESSQVDSMLPQGSTRTSSPGPRSRKTNTTIYQHDLPDLLNRSIALPPYETRIRTMLDVDFAKIGHLSRTSPGGEAPASLQYNDPKGTLRSLLDAFEITRTIPTRNIEVIHFPSRSCQEPIPVVANAMRNVKKDKHEVKQFLCIWHLLDIGDNCLLLLRGREAISLDIMSFGDYHFENIDKNILIVVEESATRIVGEDGQELWRLDPSREHAFLVFPLVALARILQGHSGTPEAELFLKLVLQCNTGRAIFPMYGGRGRNGNRAKQLETALFGRIECAQCGWTQVASTAGEEAMERHCVNTHGTSSDRERVCLVAGCKTPYITGSSDKKKRHFMRHLAAIGLKEVYEAGLYKTVLLKGGEQPPLSEAPMKWRCQTCPRVFSYHTTEVAWKIHNKLLHREVWEAIVQFEAPQLWTDFQWPPVMPVVQTLNNLTEFEAKLQLTAKNREERVEDWVVGDVPVPPSSFVAHVAGKKRTRTSRDNDMDGFIEDDEDYTNDDAPYRDSKKASRITTPPVTRGRSKKSRRVIYDSDE